MSQGRISSPRPRGREGLAAAAWNAGWIAASTTAVALLAFAPRAHWGDSRVLAFLAACGALLALALWLGALLVSRLARIVGLRWPAADAVRALGGAAVFVGVGAAPLSGAARQALPWLPEGAVIAGLGLAGVLGYLVARAILAGLGVRGGRIALPWAVLLAAPLLVAAGRASGLYAEMPPVRWHWLLGAGALFGVAVLLAARLRGPRRAGALTLCVAVAVAALRLASVNPLEPVAVAPHGAARASGPPVLLIVLDTFRADALDLSTGAESLTPHLARFARQADVYTHAVANGSWTLPGHASLLTGLYVGHHRVDATSEPGFSGQLARHVPSAPEIFRASGWSTACVVANGIVNLRSGLARGCQRYHNPARMWLHSTLPLRLLVLAGPSTGTLSQLVMDTSGLNVNATGDEVVDGALAALDASPEPLFLLLNFLDVHGPWPRPPDGAPPPEEARRALSKAQLGRFVGSVDETTLWRRHAQTLRQYYDAQVRVLDRELGRLFDELERRGWLERALVVVTSDHGEGFLENPELPAYFGHHSAYEAAVRIPILVRRPGQTTGSVRSDLVQQADVLPTLLEVAGLPPVPGIDGVPLGAPRSRPIVTEWYTRIGGGSFPYVPERREAIYERSFKYLRDAKGREFLYDLDRSPYEGADVIAEHAGTAQRLRETLAEAVVRDETGEPETTLDPQLREKLRQLGYLE